MVGVETAVPVAFISRELIALGYQVRVLSTLCLQRKSKKQQEVSMNFVDTHKNRIRESATSNPLAAYFLGNFHLCKAKQKRQVYDYLRQLRSKSKIN